METMYKQAKKSYYMQFKSYYVVWKLEFDADAVEGQTCLNRTMQYGNVLSHSFRLVCVSLFKSYYVVWKPDVIKTGIIQNFLGLNRTMQYGNFENFEGLFELPSV